VRHRAIGGADPVEEARYGKKYWGALRATFVIDGDGIVAHVIPRVTPRITTTRC
jgi:peroxiredoxin